MTSAERQPMPDDHREALEFLRTGRRLHGLSSAQYRRIGQRLTCPTHARRRGRLLPVLVAVGLVLIAGTALARVVDLSQLPIVGRLFPARVSPPPQKKGGSHGPRALAPTKVPGATRTEVPGTVAPAVPADGLPAPASETPAPPAATAAKPEPSAGTPSSLSSPSRSDGPAAATPVRHPRRSLAREASVPSAPETPAPEVVMRRQPSAVAPPALPPAFAEDPVMAESRSFSQAAARWHRDHDASTALAALDAHERLFPRGQMQTETLLLRGEILLQLGREQESLALLDRLPLAELPRGRELLTVRGELRVKYGRCPEARRDLDRVLSRNRGDALARRAARALALCP